MKYDLKPLITLADILDYPLLSPKGEMLGIIADIAIEPQNGQIAYVVLQASAGFGYGKRLYALPWECLSYKEIVHTFVVNITQSKLANLPSFDPERWPTEANPKIKAYLAQTKHNQLASNPSQNQTNHQVLEEMAKHDANQLKAELEVAVDSQGYNQNPSEQQVYPGLQPLDEKKDR